MVAANIIYMIKTLHAEGFITINADYEDIKSVLEEFDLDRINDENFCTEDEY